MTKQSSYLTVFQKMQPQALPRPILEEWNWQLEGSCQGYPSEVFFPESEGRQGRRQREEAAKEICRECPVLARCRDHALKTPEVHGVWGAMTARERAKALAQAH
ncbi:WhiB family transcriptional regulator [Mycobacterium sp. NPDC003449]